MVRKADRPRDDTKSQKITITVEANAMFLAFFHLIEVDPVVAIQGFIDDVADRPITHGTSIFLNTAGDYVSNREYPGKQWFTSDQKKAILLELGMQKGFLQWAKGQKPTGFNYVNFGRSFMAAIRHKWTIVKARKLSK